MKLAALLVLLAFPASAADVPGVETLPEGFWDTPRAISMPDGAVIAPLTPTGGLEKLIHVPGGAYVNDKALALLAEKTKPVNLAAVIALSFAAGLVSGAATGIGVYALVKR